MELKQYESLTADLHKTATDVANAKRPDYTIGNADVLKNFKSVAERLGLDPMQVWAVYALKHVDAICAYAKGNRNPSEPIKMRFVDWLNYGDLGYALAAEAQAELLDGHFSKSAAECGCPDPAHDTMKKQMEDERKHLGGADTDGDALWTKEDFDRIIQAGRKPIPIKPLLEQSAGYSMDELKQARRTAERLFDAIILFGGPAPLPLGVKPERSAA